MRLLITLTFVFATFAIYAQDFNQQVNVQTIPNQSATFARMPSREASTDVDAVFFNPAGLVKLENGLHLSINNQILNQNTFVTSDYENLSTSKTFEGRASAYTFPSLFGAYKKDRWALSLGIHLPAGGGGAGYDNVPSADMGISDIPPAMIDVIEPADLSIFNSSGRTTTYSDITDYRFDFYSKGSGYYPGVQLNFSYAFNDFLSIAAGGRVIRPIIEAEGHVKAIEIYSESNGGWQNPEEYLRMVASDPDLDIVNRAIINATASIYGDLGQDREIKAKQTGVGFTPIVGINLSPSPETNVGIKYEFNTPVTLATEVIDSMDGGGVYHDSVRIRADLPGFVSVGVSHDLTEKITLAAGMRYAFYKQADLNGRDSLINGNYFEVAIAGAYKVKDKLTVSTGYTYSNPDVDGAYHNEADFFLPAHTVAAGFAYQLNSMIELNVGGFYSAFVAESHSASHIYAPGFINDERSYNVHYDKNAWILAIGLDLQL